MTRDSQAFRDIYFTTRDGLRLYGRHYPAAFHDGTVRRPVLCLAGLTRNCRDFNVIAEALSQRADGPRDVYTFDYRGRGLSESDPDWTNYAVPIEMLDVLDFMIVAGIQNASIIGTSRGGLIAMVMAAAQPCAVGPVVLNDIGPVIEQKGLGRISAYVGRIPLPGSWAEAGSLVHDMSRRAFPAVPVGEWIEVAKQWFNEHKGRPAPGYDPELSNALSVLDGPIPALWPQFEALKRVPVLVLRGETSDILSAETVEEMRRRHPAFSSFVVPGQGHAPLLRDQETIDQIANFLAASETSERQPRLAYG
ncbi:alpha/beta hydrolase [Hyphomicrobium sp. LHD-15]|uniref:alpha/beta fold hydrolase n=1 Tax=Hyphomicrobium sp. LHD-15 TaxID=3072142 RepID=UPI00280F6B5C|nr:alpha/beta hydrolase [Hyphomicrobium sp. LHD-15]MDQ8697905.1 alpha/beta hydrolase [Hyphomicrobium sp. LHD-15]